MKYRHHQRRKNNNNSKRVARCLHAQHICVCVSVWQPNAMKREREREGKKKTGVSDSHRKHILQTFLYFFFMF